MKNHSNLVPPSAVGKVIYDCLLFKLEKAIPPKPEIAQELDEIARRITKKLKNLKQMMPVHKDKLNFFMAQSKGQVSKLYKLVIRRQFFRQTILVLTTDGYRHWKGEEWTGIIIELEKS